MEPYSIAAFGDWDFSLDLIPLRFIRVVACMAGWFLCIDWKIFGPAFDQNTAEEEIHRGNPRVTGPLLAW